MTLETNDATDALSLTRSFFRVFSVPELADVIISYLSKTNVLSLRSVCRALHRAISPFRWIGGDVASMTECFQGADQDPLYEFKKYNVRTLGSDKVPLAREVEHESMRRALRECPNLTALRLSFYWEENWAETMDAIMDAFKDNVFAVLQCGEPLPFSSSFADMSLSTGSTSNNNDKSLLVNHYRPQNSVPATGLKLLYLRFQPQEDDVLLPANLSTALDALSKRTIEITPDIAPYVERHAVLSRLVTPATPTSPMSLPVLPQLRLLDISIPCKQNFVVSWDSLVRFLTTVAPNLKELWLNRISVQVTSDDLNTEGPEITSLKILGFRCLIGDALAKRVVKTFTQIEELSVYNITPFWHQTHIASPSAVGCWPMSKGDRRLSATTSGNGNRTRSGAKQDDDEYKWTPFPYLKFLRLRSPNQKVRLETIAGLVPLEEHQVPYCFNNLFLEGGHVDGLQTALSLKMPPSLRLQRLTVLSHADWNPSVDKECDRIWAQLLMKPCCDELRALSFFQRTTIIRSVIADLRTDMTLRGKNAALLGDDSSSPHIIQDEEDKADGFQEDEQAVEERKEREIVNLYSSEAYLSVLRQSIRTKISFASHLRSLRLQGYWARHVASKAFIMDVNLFLHCCPRLTDFWMLDGSVSDVDLLFKGLGRCPDSSPQLSTAGSDPHSAAEGGNEDLTNSTTPEIIIDRGLHDVAWINGERPHLQKLQLGMSGPMDNGEIEKRLRERFRHMDMLRLYFQ